MINTLAMFLSPEERRRSRYPVHAAAKAEADAFDPDLFVQGLLKARLITRKPMIRGKTFS